MYLQSVINTHFNHVNPLSASPTKWSNTLKKLVGNLAINCLSVFDHFVGLATFPSHNNLIHQKYNFVHGEFDYGTSCFLRKKIQLGISLPKYFRCTNSALHNFLQVEILDYIINWQKNNFFLEMSFSTKGI